MMKTHHDSDESNIRPGAPPSRRLAWHPISADLVAWFYDHERSRHRVAELASLVEEAAQENDASAQELLDHAAFHLASAARAVDDQLGFEVRYPLVLTGGAFRACPSLGSRIDAQLELPWADPTLLDGEPARGAVTLALELLDA